MELTEIEKLIEQEREYLLEAEGLVAPAKLVARAAYAIFERLKRDVVWQDVEAEATVVKARLSEAAWIDLGFSKTGDILHIPVTKSDVPDMVRERVQVTVRRKGGSPG